MRKLSDQLGELGKDGVRHLNANTPGCPFCGHVDVKFDEAGKLALYHPGAECCAERIQQQIEWRRNDLAAVTHRVEREKAELNKRAEEHLFKGDLHAALYVLDQKEAALKEPIAEELRHAGDALARIRRTT